MNIYFIGPLSSTFVQNDIEILSTQHKLTLESSNIGRGWKSLLRLFTLAFKSVIKAFSNEACFCWFADYATLAPTLIFRLFGKKVYVIAGGFDVGYIPEMNYGARARAFRWFCVKNTFHFATKIFPVSKFANENLGKLTEGKHAPTVIIYNGVKLERFIDFDVKFKRKLILTVSQADNHIEYIRKGGDKFIEIASKLKDYDFILAGLQGSAYEQAINEIKDNKNIKILKGPLNLYNDIIPLYLQTSIYLQLSLEETFGVAVVEAMACGCVPIVANRTALPEIALNSDFTYNNEEELITLIKKYYQLIEEQRVVFKEHSQKFNIDIRKEKLLSVLSSK